jgi:hypothetical protein
MKARRGAQMSLIEKAILGLINGKRTITSPIFTRNLKRKINNLRI